MDSPESKLKGLWGFTLHLICLIILLLYVHQPSTMLKPFPHIRAGNGRFLFLTYSKESYYELLTSIRAELSPFLSATLTLSTAFPAADLLRPSKRSS